MLLGQPGDGVHKFGEWSDHCDPFDDFDNFDDFDPFGDFDHFGHLMILKMPRILLAALVQPVLLLGG